MPAFLDRIRAQGLMQEAGIDALILLSAEAFRHATGAAAGVATMWREAGAVAVLVPADASVPEMAVASDLFAPAFRAASHIADLRESPIWVEALEASDFDPDLPAAPQIAARRADAPGPAQRPATFDPGICYAHLRDALVERGLAQGRIGVEMAAISAADLPALKAALPDVGLIDATSICRRLRAIKAPGEIDRLRQAVTLAEQGIRSIQEAIRTGVSRDELAAVWSDTIRMHAAGLALTGAWEYISVGRNPWGGNAVASPGDLIKVDVGCLIDGYTSDTGRTFVLGKPSRAASEIHAALMAGFEAGFRRLSPGTPLSEVHRAAGEAIRARGFDSYARGHFGHSLGTGPGSEEWPFIAADATEMVTPGMVLAFECPWYITGLGGFIIEDQVEITADGPVSMNSLPHELI
ncbi:M24 family metallopeptidase [Hoeflea sp.]|uniref:M24 family metallopeptidase n=1 Tax=Hoeflea sp. TaxID=1940281 RepID=UPI003BB0DCD1